MNLHDTPSTRAHLTPELRARIRGTQPDAARLHLDAYGPDGPFTAWVSLTVDGRSTIVAGPQRHTSLALAIEAVLASGVAK
jgi:hypothetical protein